MSDIQIRGPKGCGKTLSFAGDSYAADKKGVFSVPSEAWEQLQRHGFKVEGQPDDPVETDEERAAREAAEAEAAKAAQEAAEAEARAAAEAAAKAAAGGGAP